MNTQDFGSALLFSVKGNSHKTIVWLLMRLLDELPEEKRAELIAGALKELSRGRLSA